MALFCKFNNTDLISTTLSFRSSSSSSSSSLFKSPNFNKFSLLSFKKIPNSSSFFVRSLTTPSGNEDNDDDDKEWKKSEKRLSEQSSWEAKDSEGNDYLYRLGKEADNMNIAVGARVGVIDDLFAGKFLGRDSDIVFDYRQKVTRSFEYLQGDYYIAPVFMDKVGKFSESIRRERNCDISNWSSRKFGLGMTVT
uniref:Uncharacterized protein n=1 Tax=Davidia involucrata TaxID=16924 RepID=A0A5B7B4P2_DAVIN